MVRMVEIACPRCRSTDVSAQAPERFHCNHCHTHFLLDRGARPAAGQPASGPQPATPPPPRQQYGAAPAPSAPSAPQIDAAAWAQAHKTASKMRWLSWGIWLVVMAVFVGGGLITTFTSSMRASELVDQVTGKTAKSEPGAAAEDPPFPEGVAVEISDVASGATDDGTKFWIATYANTGKVAIESPAIALRFLDPAGARVGQEIAQLERELLEPGQRFPVMVAMRSPPAHDKVTVVAHRPKPVQYGSKQRPLVVTHHELRTEKDGRYVVGKVRNERDAKVELVEIIVVGRDKAGKPVSFATGYATDKSLAAGKTGAFKVKVGGYELEKPARYELHGMGRILD